MELHWSRCCNPEKRVEGKTEKEGKEEKEEKEEKHDERKRRSQ
jgi:hypothetical protein